MNTKTIKKVLREKFELTEVRVRSTGTKTPYFDAWLPFESKQAFSAEFGNRALAVIYGAAATQPAADGTPARISFPAGNVRPNCVSMHEHEWAQLLATYGVTE